MNAPLQGTKATLWEGGIRVPWAMQWPGKIPAGKVYGQPVISLDIFSTVAAMAGAEVPSDRPMDGVDLMPYLSGGNNGQPHEALYWRLDDSLAVRRGNLKLLRQSGGPFQLFDLAQDPGEAHDLASQKPEAQQTLAGLLDQWNRALATPLWDPPNRRKGPGKRAVGGGTNRRGMKRRGMKRGERLLPDQSQ